MEEPFEVRFNDFLKEYKQKRNESDFRTKCLIRSSKENTIDLSAKLSFEDLFIAIYYSTNNETQMSLAVKFLNLLYKMNYEDKALSDLLIFKICWETNNKELYSFLRKHLYFLHHRHALLKKKKNREVDREFIEQTSSNLKSKFSHLHKLEAKCDYIDEKENVHVYENELELV